LGQQENLLTEQCAQDFFLRTAQFVMNKWPSGHLVVYMGIVFWYYSLVGQRRIL
jgi:hypothetical protein